MEEDDVLDVVPAVSTHVAELSATDSAIDTEVSNAPPSALLEPAPQLLSGLNDDTTSEALEVPLEEIIMQIMFESSESQDRTTYSCVCCSRYVFCLSILHLVSL